MPPRSSPGVKQLPPFLTCQPALKILFHCWGQVPGTQSAPSWFSGSAFLMKGEVWKLWNKYPKAMVSLNKWEISQIGAPPWNSLVLECLVLFIEDSSLTQGLRWPGRERSERIQISLRWLDQMTFKIPPNIESLGSSDLISAQCWSPHTRFSSMKMSCFPFELWEKFWCLVWKNPML